MQISHLTHQVMACAFAVTCAFSAQAAEVDLPNWEALNSEVRTKGIVNVLVHLAPVGLGEMANDLKAVKARMASKANTLVAELGQEAWAAGRDDNGIGQMSLNVTEVGLKILRSSANAVRFTVGLPLQARAVVFPEGGSIEAIERELAEKGRAHVQVVLNIEALQFDVECVSKIRLEGCDPELADIKPQVGGQWLQACGAADTQAPGFVERALERQLDLAAWRGGEIADARGCMDRHDQLS